MPKPTLSALSRHPGRNQPQPDHGRPDSSAMRSPQRSPVSAQVDGVIVRLRVTLRLGKPAGEVDLIHARLVLEHL